MKESKQMVALPPKQREEVEKEIFKKWKIREVRPLCDNAKRITKEEAVRVQFSRTIVSHSKL